MQGLKDTAAVTNWAEVANVSDQPAGVLLTFRDESGVEQDIHWQEIQPKAQFHYQASALLPANSSGVLEVLADQPVVVQSMSYVHGSANELQAGFASPARPRGRAEQAGTINTFLQMQNVLQVFSTHTAAVDVQFEISSFRGGTFSGALSLDKGGSSILQISNNPALNFPADTYGALLLDTGQAGYALGEVRRVRVVEGAVDYVMPTRVQ